MVDEYHSLMMNGTWDLVPQLQEKNVMGMLKGLHLKVWLKYGMFW